MNDLQAWLRQRVEQGEFREFLAETLLELCRIDTIPTAATPDSARREGEALALIESAIRRFALPGRLQRRALPDSIRSHPFYTFPFYAGTVDAYAGRANLVYRWDPPGPSPAADGSGSQLSPGSPGIAVNAHIDTVSPYFPPRREGELLYGRGACDDKGGCAVMIGALRLIREASARFSVLPTAPLTFMFAIDEEMGGNGSLALALDQELAARYGTVAVLECCDGQVHPGGRGAVWYRVEIPNPGPGLPDGNPAAPGSAPGQPAAPGSAPGQPAGPRLVPWQAGGHEPLLLALEVIREMDREGAAIRDESVHRLFPQVPVQTSPGILGPFGEHPSRVCGSLGLFLETDAAREELERLLEKGLEEYIRRYGDKTARSARAEGDPRLARHFDLMAQCRGGARGFLLRVHGLSGHMGALRENDNALIKAAYLLEQVSFDPADPHAVRSISFPDGSLPPVLLLEGGQGFLPTHSIEAVKRRLVAAVRRAYRRYARSRWKRLPYFRDAAPVVSFSKLHNEAYQTDPRSAGVRKAVAAAEHAGIEVRLPLVGWEVSSDARIFAHLRPEAAVFTTGPGKLALAHSDEERISVSELARSSLMLALFLLDQDC